MGVLATLFLGNWAYQAIRPARAIAIGPGVPGEVVVQVVGAVKRPGVIRLPAGGRVADAVEEAGGGTADADLGRINLAARATDGTQIRVPRVTDPEDAGETIVGAPAAASMMNAAPVGVTESAPPVVDPAAGGGVSINSASQAELESLPGIGPALAQRILEYRQANGPFRSIDELDAVKGIGPKSLAKLRPFLKL